MSETAYEKMVNSVNSFMAANYPCGCGMDGCPESLEESEEIVDRVLNIWAAETMGRWRTGYYDA